jgi:hypothetical protein
MSQIQQYRNILYYPLDFWFTQNYSHMLPIMTIKYSWCHETIDLVINETILKHKNERYNSSIFNNFYPEHY